MMAENYRENFGCCKVLWKIENFYLATCKEDWSICSPEYSVRGKYLTTWKITLKPNMSRKDEDDGWITAYLKRLENGQGPDVVQANWKMSLLSRERTEFIFTENVRSFEKNCCYAEDLLSLSSLWNKFQPFEADIVYLQCLLIVSFPDIPEAEFRLEEDNSSFYSFSKNLYILYPSEECYKNVLRKHERRVSSLSEDLSILFASSSLMSHDLVLKIKDKEILTHKAILYARNPTFAAILDKSPNINVVYLFPTKRFDESVALFEKSDRPIVNSNAIERVIAYLYSGNMEVVLNKPSITIYESALAFDITEIIDYYNPDALILRTSTKVEEFVFFWKIFCFDFNDHILSPALKLKDTVWRLRIFLTHGEENSEYISIFAEIIDGMKSLTVSLEFALLNDRGEFVGYRRMLKHIKLGGILGFYDFVKKDASTIENNSVSIIFKLRQSCGLETSACECSSVSFVTPVFTKADALSLLSEDMTCLFENGKFSDAVIYCGDDIFNVHKCVLLTRTTREFCTLLHKNSVDKNEFLLSEIKPEVLKMFLRFVYSGTIGECEKCILYDIFKLAEKMNMVNLQLMCEEILKEK